MKDGTKKPKIEKSTYKRGDVNCALRIKLECAVCVCTHLFLSPPAKDVSLKSENGILERVVEE